MSVNPDTSYLVMEMDGSRMLEPPTILACKREFDDAWQVFFNKVTEYYKDALSRPDGAFEYPPTGELVQSWRDFENKMLDEYFEYDKYVLRAGRGDWEAEEPFNLIIQEIASD